MKLALRLALVLLGTLSITLASATELTPHRAEYKVKISVLTGELNTELLEKDGKYTATHIVTPTGLSRIVTNGKLFVTSTFAPSADGLRPLGYRAVDTIGDEPESDITFDWAAGVARGTVDGVPVELPLDGPSYDAVSIQYELMYDLLNKLPSEDYVLFDVKELHEAHVSQVGRKTVNTKAGKYEVVGIQHQKEGSSRIMTLWCAPELDYLPVVIEQHRKGKLKFRATLTSYTPL